MKFAVIGDIHSNKYALMSVLENIKAQKVDTILCTGDLVGYLPFSNEVIDLLRTNHVFTVKGNHDDVVAKSEFVSKNQLQQYDLKMIQSRASLLYTNHVIRDENRLYLKNLPNELKFNICGKVIQVVHGSHRHISEYLYLDESELSEVAKTVTSDVLICGHTHIPYHVKIENVDFINVGSVGKPKTGDELATYTIVDINENQVRSEVIKVKYDLQQLTKDIEDEPMISNELILMLKQGY